MERGEVKGEIGGLRSESGVAARVGEIFSISLSIHIDYRRYLIDIDQYDFNVANPNPRNHPGITQPREICSIFFDIVRYFATSIFNTA